MVVSGKKLSNLLEDKKDPRNKIAVKLADERKEEESREGWKRGKRRRGGQRTRLLSCKALTGIRRR